MDVLDKMEHLVSYTHTEVQRALRRIQQPRFRRRRVRRRATSIGQLQEFLKGGVRGPTRCQRVQDSAESPKEGKRPLVALHRT